MSTETILDTISEQLQNGQASDVKQNITQALEQGIEPNDILQNGLMHGMGIIGEKFKNNVVYVPGVLIAARAMNAGMEELKPALQKAGIEAKGTACIGTVQGDLHDIGKNLVCMMLEGGGYEVVDLGVNVESATFVNTVKEYDAAIVGMSALLTTTMPVMQDVITGLREANLREDVKVLVGGAPLNQSFADEIGADGFASDAATAVNVSDELLGY